jgi:HK97 family phage major capsid protein
MSAITDVRRPIEDLSLAQINQEIATRFQQAETAMKAGRPDDLEEAKRLLGEVDQFEVVRGSKESAEQMAQRIAGGRKQYGTPARPMAHPEAAEVAGGGINRREGKSLGHLFVESREYKGAIENGIIIPDSQMGGPLQVTFKEFSLVAQAMEHKLLLVGNSTTSAGAGVINDFQPGYLDIRQRAMTLLDLISRIPTSSDTIDYLVQTTFTNNAAGVAEATATTGTSGTKPETDLNFARVTKPVETIAHWVPVTTRALADFPQIQAIIDGQLRLGIDLALESYIITGNGSSPNLEGILSNTGVQTRALGTDSTPDALFKLMVQVQVTGLAIPNGIVMNPLNWQTVRLLRENAATASAGGYLLGPPSMVGASTLWGLPVVLSIGMTANTAVVADWSMATMALYDREQTTVRTGYANDDFIRNMVRLLAEMRAAFAIFRPTAIAKVTGLS